MKLTYICGFAWEPKGTVRARAFPLAEEMVRRGHEVTLIIAPYDNRAYSGVEFVRNGVQVVNVGMEAGIAGLARVPYELVKKISETKPDLVHVFKPKGFAGLAAIWLLLRNRPFVLDCDDWEGWGGWNQVKEYPWLVKEFIDFQEKWIIRRSAAVTVVSQALMDRASAMRMDTEQIFYVPNGPTSQQLELSRKLLAQPEKVRQEKFGFNDAPVILYAGHYDPADDVMFYCRAVVHAAQRKRINLAFVGDGPELTKVRSFFAKVPEIATSFFGALAYEQYVGLVAAADICAFPYPDTPIYRAKCSARIIDYMLFGKAVVSTSVGQNSEYIVNEVSGVLTPPGDELAFAEGIIRVIEDKEFRHQLGINARTRILQNFLWGGSAGDNCERAYYSLLPQKQTQPVTLLAS